MNSDKNFEQQKVQITFEYYKQQREEANQLARERASLSLQLLVIAGALSTVLLQLQLSLLKFGLSIAIVVLGVIGLVLVRNYERSIMTHMNRARAARQSIGFLEEFAATSKDFGTLHTFYYAMHIFVIAVGILFTISIFM